MRYNIKIKGNIRRIHDYCLKKRAKTRAKYFGGLFHQSTDKEVLYVFDIDSRTYLKLLSMAENDGGEVIQ
jgi:hypothetical protein